MPPPPSQQQQQPDGWMAVAALFRPIRLLHAAAALPMISPSFLLANVCKCRRNKRRGSETPALFAHRRCIGIARNGGVVFRSELGSGRT